MVDQSNDVFVLTDKKPAGKLKSLLNQFDTPRVLAAA
jgi:hypothetical protein